MGRCGSIRQGVPDFLKVLLLGLLACRLPGCGKSSGNPLPLVPAAITLTPATNASLDIGATQQFIATALSATRVSIGAPITYVSSNPAVVTISNGGLACGGNWDSLSNPIVCPPGRTGVA